MASGFGALSMARPVYSIIEHTADTGFEVRGATREEVFQAAALAFFDMMWLIGVVSRETSPVPLEISGGDLEELLVNFLEEFLYLYDARELVCTGVTVEAVSEAKVNARVWLQQFNAAGDRELLGVKAVTYHQLFIGREENSWVARVFLDI